MVVLFIVFKSRDEYVVCRWDFGLIVGEFDGYFKWVLSCVFKLICLFCIVICGEDFFVNFYEGFLFWFKVLNRYV